MADPVSSREASRAEIPREVLRFDRSIRVQHVCLFVCLAVLALTGLALRFHQNPLAAFLIRMEGGIASRGIIHRVAALCLLGLGAYHAYYVTFNERGHRELMALKLGPRDLSDWLGQVAFDLGRREAQPRHDRYSYRQKFQYWGVWVGCLVIAATGFLLWFEDQTMQVLPKWGIDLILVIHGYQGVLIFLLLLVWHLYNVHLSPGVFPMDKVWLTGRLPIERLEAEHPLEYERLVGNRGAEEESVGNGAGADRERPR